MIVDDRIVRLALVDWPEGEAVPRIEGWQPRELSSRALLVVRRLSVIAEPSDVPAAVTAEVRAGAARAVRPHRGALVLEADAVLFDDVSEMLACYLLAVASDSLEHHWCWPLLRTALPPGSLSAVVSDQGTPVLGVCAALLGWDRLGEVVEDLDRATRWRVLTALAERHALWLREVGADGATTGGLHGGLGGQELTPKMSRARAEMGSDSHGPSSGRDGPSEIGDGAPAQVAPRDSPVSTPASGQAALPGVAPGTWQMGREGSMRVLWHLSPREGFAGGLTRLAEMLLGRRPRAVDGERLAVPHRMGGSGSEPARAAATTASAEPAGRVAPYVRSPDPAAVGMASPAEACPHGFGLDDPGPSGEIERGASTHLGGVLYLINLLNRFDALAFGLDDAVTWDVVDGLARAALDWPQGEFLSRDDLIWDDPIWDVLAALGGREPGEAPDLDVAHRCVDVLTALMPALAFADDEPRWTTLLSVSGRVVSDATHVDFFTTSSQVHLSIRRRALDSDPGWVPSLGRVVLFHFAGQQP